MHRTTFAALMLALLLHATSATALPAETPDPAPDFALQRNTGSGLGPGHVEAFAPHPNGGMIVGGDFVIGDTGAPRTYLLRVLPAGAAQMATFSSAVTAEIAAVKALFGEITAKGRSPVSIPGVARLGEPTM